MTTNEAIAESVFKLAAYTSVTYLDILDLLNSGNVLTDEECAFVREYIERKYV